MNDKLRLLPETEPWYADGLRFHCTECGKCCTGSPGYTWVNEEEIAAMAKELDISIEEFGKRYLRKVGRRYSLLERPGSYDCIFLEGKKSCLVYKVRPTQCRTFPFWPSTLATRDQWQQEALHCEGINHPNAKLIPVEEIDKQRILQKQQESRL